MRSKRFFKAFLSGALVAAVVFVFSPAGGIQSAMAAQDQATPVVKTVPAESSSSRVSGFPEDDAAAESYGSSYWGFMQDN